jgi:hypothetical protein
VFRKIKGRPSERDRKEQVNAAHRQVAAMIQDPEKRREYESKFIHELPPKRDKVKRPVDGKPAVPLEAAVNDDIYATYSRRPDVKLWRNNRGVAQYGQQIVRYGVGPRGASDWIGYRVVTITQEMVGQRLAQFAALEAKRPGETPDDNQQRFLDSVTADGGVAGWADSAAKAREILP